MSENSRVSCEIARASLMRIWCKAIAEYVNADNGNSYTGVGYYMCSATNVKISCKT